MTPATRIARSTPPDRVRNRSRPSADNIGWAHVLAVTEIPGTDLGPAPVNRALADDCLFSAGASLFAALSSLLQSKYSLF